MMLINRQTVVAPVADPLCNGARTSCTTLSWVCVIAAFAYSLLVSSVCVAGEPTRVWVDASGNFTIEASLEGINHGIVTLVRPDGSRVSIAERQLGSLDQDYVAQWQSRPRMPRNSLRLSPLKSIEMPLLPKLALPSSSKMLEDGKALAAIPESLSPEPVSPESGKGDHRPMNLAALGPIPADPLADSLSIGFGHLTIGQLHAYDRCSAPLVINSKRGTFVAVSVSTGLMAKPEEANRIIRFDPKAGESKLVWVSKLPLTLLDHNLSTKLTLALDGHNASGHGGQLAIIGDWDAESISIQFRRSIPESIVKPVRSSYHLNQVHWAKWLDNQHVVVLIDTKLAVWNVFSGEFRHLICSIDPQSRPALSAGRHYVAVPDPGGVRLYQTRDGKFLGRLQVEPNRYANVAFSPQGNSLAITTSTRLRIWELSTAAFRGEVTSRRSLGKGTPIWIDNDLVLSSSGVLLSTLRGVPVWRYELVGTEVRELGKQTIGILFRRPTGEIVVSEIPHPAAKPAIAAVDNRLSPQNIANWQVPGRSRWVDGQWVDEVEN